ncbi:FAD-dependent oxidoreductase [Catelliglobosispora koreensis]|uniref:FAD-dependent oxidoreductase n=1 Tax=Catelliglobosispora koreensis TaxID=129052 RepID=UPI00037A9188|nr:FAD-dependent monooxygenase [Catelliglobosispora koreensis]
MTHAVVIGASIAGLTAAQALSSRFDEVTILDRDSLPSDHSARRGVPQGKHLHILLAAGQRALDELFPGLVNDMTAAGAVPFDPGVDLGVHRYGGLWPRQELGIDLMSFSRPLLEAVLRQRLSANVTIKDNTAVGGLLGGKHGVTGVRTDAEHIDADLVVDASGRGSRSDRWLEELGFPAPEVAEVKINVGYASQFLHRDAFLPEGKGMFVLPTPPGEKRSGALLPVDGDRWLLTVGGWHGDFPRTDAEFRTFAHSLPYKGIGAMLSSQQPVSGVAFSTFPSSRRRYFEKLKELPNGYVAMGDAVCSFNPIYGQGMTAASLEAVALGQLLDRGPLNPREFYQRVSNILKAPWRFAVGGDFNFPETTGPKPAGISLLNGYAARIQRAAQSDYEVRRVFSYVQHLMLPPSALFRPSIVAKTLFKKSS